MSLGHINDHMSAPNGGCGIQTHDPWVQRHGPYSLCHWCRLVYVIECQFCNIQNVGETQKPLRTRMNGHRFAIKRGDQSSALFNHLYDHWSKSDIFKEVDIHLDAFTFTHIEQISDFNDFIFTIFVFLFF